MSPRPLTILDGHDPAHRTRFGQFAARVIEGGSVRDEDCHVVRRPSWLVRLWRIVRAWL